MWPSARPGTAATTVVTAVVLLLGQTGDHHSVDAATCCVNSTSGEPFNSSSFSLPSPCVCLTDNTLITGQNLTRGESALYHWVLETSSSELITLVPRGNVTFKLSPCNGSAHMDIKTASPSSWPYMPSFSSGSSFSPITFTTSVQATEYTVFVTASNESDLTFEMATYNTLYDRPIPGGGGLLAATMPTASTAAVAINTSDTGSGDVQYRLYWSTLSEDWDGDTSAGEQPPGCVAPTYDFSLMNNSQCLFSSVCGMARAAEGMTGWESVENGIGHAFEAPVSSGVQYIFNVAMRDARNITYAYQATNMSFSFTTYQQCVSDPDCESQLQSDTTIVAVATAVVIFLAMLVISVKCLHLSIRSTMEEAARTSASKKPLRSAKVNANRSSIPEGRRVYASADRDTNDLDDGPATPAITPAPGARSIGFGNDSDGDELEWEDATKARRPKSGTRRIKSPEFDDDRSSHPPSSAKHGDSQNRKAHYEENGGKNLNKRIDTDHDDVDYRSHDEDSYGPSSARKNDQRRYQRRDRSDEGDHNHDDGDGDNTHYTSDNNSRGDTKGEYSARPSARPSACPSASSYNEAIDAEEESLPSRRARKPYKDFRTEKHDNKIGGDGGARSRSPHRRRLGKDDGGEDAADDGDEIVRPRSGVMTGTSPKYDGDRHPKSR